MSTQNTRPGIHPKFEMDKYTQLEESILYNLAKEWYLTSSGKIIQFGSSSYANFLMKPTKLFSEMFNLEREIICVFSKYDSFEPRNLDAFSVVEKK